MENSSNTPPEFLSEEIVLETIKEVFEISVSPRDFSLLKFRVQPFFGGYIAQIQRNFYGERTQKKVDVSFTFQRPKTWWQQFKEENFPAWLLKKYPVIYTSFTETKVVEIDRNFIFPNAYREGHSILGKFIIRDFCRVKSDG